MNYIASHPAFNDKDFLNYLIQFISETDLDMVRGAKKSWSK